jgi:hypothetical protein
MTSYIYRGVQYTQSNTFVGAYRQSTLVYRGISYTKQKPKAATLDRSKVCYRGFRLAGVTAPEANHSGAFLDLVAHHKLAH